MTGLHGLATDRNLTAGGRAIPPGSRRTRAAGNRAIILDPPSGCQPSALRRPRFHDWIKGVRRSRRSLQGRPPAQALMEAHNLTVLPKLVQDVPPPDAAVSNEAA